MKEKIEKISKNLKSKFFFNYDLSAFTWFRTGGCTDIFCIVYDETELEIILNNLDEKTPIFVIGVGSNVLIRDGGFRGIIIKLGKSFNKLIIENDLIHAGSSILDSNISKFASLNLLQGLEFFSGIPGSVGGAVKMNAGCYGGETRNVLKEVLIMKRNGEKKILSNNELEFSYRFSNLSENDIILSAIFKGNYGEKDEIEKKILEIKSIRENSQPIKAKTGGSTFKNPKLNYAAKLIEDADCKGLSYGDAIVSSKHSNFIVNLGNASALDIENLGKTIKEKVMKKHSIALEWEIKIIGEYFE